MSKNSSKIAYAAVAVLGETFPEAFARRGAERRPLKIGIARDLAERGVDLDVIRAGLGSYCRSYGYLSAMKAGASRVDLDGSIAGIVTAEEATSAQERLAELKPAPATPKPPAAKAKPQREPKASAAPAKPTPWPRLSLPRRAARA
jgi:ProP effector